MVEGFIDIVCEKFTIEKRDKEKEKAPRFLVGFPFPYDLYRLFLDCDANEGEIETITQVCYFIFPIMYFSDYNPLFPSGIFLSTPSTNTIGRT